MSTPAVSNARHPQRGCRVAWFIGGLILGCCAASGEEAGCDQVPESRRAQCLKVLSCLRVDDEQVRRACIDAAQQPEAEPAPSSEDQPTRDEPPIQEDAPILHEQQVVPAEPETDRVRREVPVREDAPSVDEPRPRDAPRAQSASPAEPPDEWSGTVSRIYQSILDRQLIAVDGKYLFESDRAAHARLEAGERVEVAKVSSRFFRGSRRWRITGESRTQIRAFRIHCESEDIRADDRRKCAQMLPR